MTRLAIIVKQNRCIGCHTCALACKMQNNVAQNMLWNRVLTEGCDIIDGARGTYPRSLALYLPLACQHCENPACQKVCPTGATYKDDKGRVEIDYDRCIGSPHVHGGLPLQRAQRSTGESQRATRGSTTETPPCRPAAKA